MTEVMIELADALLCLRTVSEIRRFLRDLCTPKEIYELERRWEICQLLQAGQLSYREIAEKLKTSVTTVTYVARFLRKEPNQGYATAFKRIRI